MRRRRSIQPADFKFDEKMIQALIWRNYDYKTVIPNIYVDKRSRIEVDAMHITTAGYPIFFEIKISKSDFKEDFKKTRHKEMLKRNEYSNFMLIKPKQFYYVIHGFEVKLDEIPEYAGLIIVDEWNGVSTFEPAKEAPILWQEKLGEKQWEFINKKLLHRVMNSKMKESRDVFIDYRNQQNRRY